VKLAGSKFIAKKYFQVDLPHSAGLKSIPSKSLIHKNSFSLIGQDRDSCYHHWIVVRRGSFLGVGAYCGAHARHTEKVGAWIKTFSESAPKLRLEGLGPGLILAYTLPSRKSNFGRLMNLTFCCPARSVYLQELSESSAYSLLLDNSLVRIGGNLNESGPQSLSRRA
jgi:hypothetical protein